MAVMQLGLTAAAIAFLFVSWASWSAGYGPEIAVVRGLVSFMAVSLLAYVGELVVATAPPVQRQLADAAADEDRAGEHDGERSTGISEEDTAAVSRSVMGAGQRRPALAEQERRAA
jgi:hypothetical protein